LTEQPAGEEKVGIAQLNQERAKFLLEQLLGIIPYVKELTGMTEEARKAVEQQVAEFALSIKTSKLDKDQLEAFFKKPYYLEPVHGRPDSWYLIIPKFVDVQIGWLEKSTDAYNCFLINRYMDWLGEIPEAIKKQLDWKPPPELILDGEELHGPKGALEYAWQKYRPFLHDRDEEKIRINPKRAFDLIASLIKDGVLPFNIKPVNTTDLVERKCDFQLREYQLQAWNELKRFSAIGVYYPPGCYDTETELLTNEGWKTYGLIKDGEIVATLNAQGELEYQRITEKIVAPYKGKMYHVESTQISLLVTPNHHLYVWRPPNHMSAHTPKFGFKYPHQVFGDRDVHYKKDALWKGKATDWVIFDQRREGSGPRHPEFRVKMNEWVEFLGYWLAEGSTTHDKNGNYRVQICNKDPVIINRVFELFKGWGLHPRVSSEGEGHTHVWVLNKQLFDYLSPLGTSHTKYIPFDIKSLPAEQLMKLLDAFVKGDGKEHVMPSGNVMTQCQTSSPRLRDDIMEIALKAGLSTTSQVHSKTGSQAAIIDPDGRKRIITRKADNFRISLLKHRGVTRIAQPSIEAWEDYDGIVWCVNVPNHVLYVRRNGKPFWCGNTGKTVIALWAMTHLQPPHLVVVPTKLLREQWLERIQAHTDLQPNEYEVMTYQSAISKGSLKAWTSLIIDETHHQPANSFVKLSLIKRKYTLGLSATPMREDGREEYVFALSGRPVGLSWDYFKKLNLIKSPVCHVWIVKNFEAKLRRLGGLLQDDLRTLIFSDSLETGKAVAGRFKIPFVYGATKDNMATILENRVLVISRVGDEGMSLPDIERVIEVSWLFGSRRQELQRTTRLLHSEQKAQESHILMTLEEYLHDRKRLFSIMDKGFKIVLHREGVSEKIIEGHADELRAPRIRGERTISEKLLTLRNSKSTSTEHVEPTLPIQSGQSATFLKLPGVQRMMALMNKKQRQFYTLLLDHDGEWFSRQRLPLLLGYAGESGGFQATMDFPKMVQRGWIEQTREGGHLSYRTNIKGKMG
jgi:hypothetical protein